MRTRPRTAEPVPTRRRRWRGFSIAAASTIAAIVPIAPGGPTPVHAADCEVDGWVSGCLVSRTTNEGSNLTVAVQRILKCRGDYGGKVDGIWTDALTDAVEDFQSDTGLGVDGVVGPNTWGKLRLQLVELRRAPFVDTWEYVFFKPSGCSTEVFRAIDNGPSLITWHVKMPFTGKWGRLDDRCGGWAVSSPTMRKKAKKIANLELARWVGKHETHASMQPVLGSYWRCVNWETFHPTDDPWSAAFISTVMAFAGAGAHFAYSSSHDVYMKEAKDNRLDGVTSNPFWAYWPRQLKPKVGDLVCANRDDEYVGPGTWNDYPNLGKGRPSHCDLVVWKSADGSTIRMVGGNVGGRVSEKTLQLDSGGRIPSNLVGSKDELGYIVIVRPRNV